MQYIKELDAARAIAVFLVIIQHWFSINTGSVGVNIFFALSGFLITNILLLKRYKLEAGFNNGQRQSRLIIIWHFITRRALRIFPIYYLLLIVLLVCGQFFSVNIQGDFVYYATYTDNFLMYNRQQWPGPTSHLWTLAVEEQFYIIWPWFIIFCGKKWLPFIISAFIISGILLKYFLMGSATFQLILTPNCFDAFGIGGLLAYLNVYKKSSTSKAITALPLVTFLLPLAIWIVNYAVYNFMPERTLTAIVTATFILYCLYKPDDKFKKYFLRNRLLTGIGEISYGIYLYHNFIPQFVPRIYHRCWSSLFFVLKKHNISTSFITFVTQQKIVMLVNFAALYVIAYLSFKFIESPILKLKERFA